MKHRSRDLLARRGALQGMETRDEMQGLGCICHGTAHGCVCSAGQDGVRPDALDTEFRCNHPGQPDQPALLAAEVAMPGKPTVWLTKVEVEMSEPHRS